MSWFSKNYEKAALGGAVVIALGLAYLGFAKFGGVEEQFESNLSGKGNSVTAVAGAERIDIAVASANALREWAQAEDDGRPVDLFTGIPLFVSSKAPEEPVDLYKDEPVHPPIPNMWWIENRIDPGFGDSPNRDPDEDGFSNLEEFVGKTDPNDAKSFPPLIAKLMYLKDESLIWVLRPGYGSGGNFPFNYEDSNRQTNKTGVEGVAPNDLFFEKGVMMNRFKLLGAEVRREMNPKINIEVDVTIVRIEDQKANKAGVIYELPSPLAEQRKNEFLQYDRTAVLSLEALGLNGKEFKVEENTTFSLPFGTDKKDYKATKVTPEAVEVEYTDADGTKKTVTINKGTMPNLAE